MLKEEYESEKTEHYQHTDYLIGGELKTRFLFIKVQVISVILFLSPLIFFRIYQEEYRIAFINSTIVLMILLFNQLVDKKNKESYYLALTYTVPIVYSIATYFSLLFNDGTNFALAYLICATFFLAVRPLFAIIGAALFLVALFSVTYVNFDDYKNSKIVISYFLVSLIFAAQTLQLQKCQQKLNKLTRYDTISKARNKKVLEEDARRFLNLKALPSFKQDIYMMLIQIDDFSGIVKDYGHFSADSALVALKNGIDENIGIKEMLYHYKRDRFAVISENDEQGILSLAETLQSKIDSFKGSHIKTLSISIGIKRLNEEEVQSWIEGAKDALEQAQTASSKGGLKLVS